MATPVMHCVICKHYKKDKRCSAFNKIPDTIWSIENNHKKPYPNDKGIRFESINIQQESYKDI